MYKQNPEHQIEKNKREKKEGIEGKEVSTPTEKNDSERKGRCVAWKLVHGAK
ncbi:MAG TPA: hypothetical protein VIG98_14310 [Bacillus sp. (in: firmicutes)]